MSRGLTTGEVRELPFPESLAVAVVQGIIRCVEHPGRRGDQLQGSGGLWELCLARTIEPHFGPGLVLGGVGTGPGTRSA